MFAVLAYDVAMLNADLHCHSTVSDGLLPPDAVVHRAYANGVELLALTDHDELSGLSLAAARAEELGLRFVKGVEISISWRDETVHVVGLNIDPHNPQLVAGLAQVREGRDTRAAQMGVALEKVGVPDALQGAIKYAENKHLISRAHFARYLVEMGYARDTAEVFQHYLVRGKPGFVEHEWATLDNAVAWIHMAGGLAVIAHPGRYRMGRVAREEFLTYFKELGGDALEVVSGSHSREHARIFGNAARRYGFLASRASDFHGPNESCVDLGHADPLPSDLRPVWERFI